MEKKLRMTPEQVLENQAGGAFCAQSGGDIEFSPRTVTQRDRLSGRVVEAVIAEAQRPSTLIGGPQFRDGNFIPLRERILPNSDKAIWSVHCHNDLGMARYQLAGRREDRRCPPGDAPIINGLGSALACSLEEVVMAIKTGVITLVWMWRSTPHIVAASRMVRPDDRLRGAANKGGGGINALCPASGIHQDGVLKARDTYEIMRAEDVGWSANKIVLGKLSGRNAFKQRCRSGRQNWTAEARNQQRPQSSRNLPIARARSWMRTFWPLVSSESVTSEREQYGFVSLAQQSETGEQPRAARSFHRAMAWKSK